MEVLDREDSKRKRAGGNEAGGASAMAETDSGFRFLAGFIDLSQVLSLLVLV